MIIIRLNAIIRDRNAFIDVQWMTIQVKVIGFWIQRFVQIDFKFRCYRNILVMIILIINCNTNYIIHNNNLVLDLNKLVNNQWIKSVKIKLHRIHLDILNNIL